MWSYPPGWSGKFSTSKQRWYYWKTDNPDHTVTWHPPSWNKESLQLNLLISCLYFSCQKYCEKALIDLWLKPHDTVLEIGCGKGENISLVNKGIIYKGIDIMNTKKKNLRKADFTMEKLLIDQIKETFAFAFSLNALHNAGEALETALKSIGSILEKQGKFLFTVLDKSIEERHPHGYGPLIIQKWESDGTHKRVYIENQPENILLDVEEACKQSNFKILSTELCGTAVAQLNDFAETPIQHEIRNHLIHLQPHLDWDSRHWEYTNCFRAYLVEKII